MNGKKIRVLVVVANPEEVDAMLRRRSEMQGIEIVGVVHNRNAALAKAEELQPAVLAVDLMLPGLRSIDLIRKVAGDQPQLPILALSPSDPPHDRIMLAVEAGAQGFVSRDADNTELTAAIEEIHRGEPWLPPHQTIEVLRDGAGELAVSSQERRSRLTEILLGVVPLTGFIAAITVFLYRDYWSAIGVRVADLGIDPSTRMIDVLVVLLIIIGVAGPILFVRP